MGMPKSADNVHGFTENMYEVLIDYKGGGDEEKVGDCEMKD